MYQVSVLSNWMKKLFCFSEVSGCKRLILSSKWVNRIMLGNFVIRLQNLSFKISVELDNTGLFISPTGISEIDCATTKTDTVERGISIGRQSLKVFFVLGALVSFQVPPLGGSREEKWRSQ